MRGFPLVLCYHAVTDGWPSPLAVTPAQFERQLRFLIRAGWRPVGQADLIPGRTRRFHVTFDDAYRSVETEAVPILERLGVPSTVFACSGYADDGGPLDVPELADDVRRHPAELATLDWDGLRRIQGRGVTIGSHTVTHPHLPQVSDEQLEAELRDSKARIAAELGRPCRSIAYPYGHEDVRVHEAAKAAGYEAAWGLPGSHGRLDPMALPRVGIYRRDGAGRFAAKALARAIT